MGVRYVKEFEFPSAAGYSKSTPSKVTGQMYAKGGHVKKKYADGGGVTGPYDINNIEQAPSEVGKGAVEGAQAGALSPQMRQKLLMLQAAKRRAMMQQQAQQNAQDTRMNDVPPGANYDADQMARAERGYKKGGKVAKVMHEFGAGELHSGSKKGPKVTNPKQAVAIALSEAGKAKKAKGGMAHEDAAQDKAMIKSMVKPGALKKADGGMAQKVQMAKSNAIEASLKGQKKTGYADGGIAPPTVASPLQMMGRPKGVPVAPRGPMIPQQAAAPGGARIGVNAPRPGGPNVGAIRAAMARKASQAMPENAPSMMKKGGKVGC
jgi:hypothetical protein